MDLIGKQFEELKVLSFSHKDKYGYKHYVCQCSCGNIKTILGYSVKSGRTKSCGCLKTKALIERNKKNKSVTEWQFNKDTISAKVANCEKQFVCDKDDFKILEQYSFHLRKNGYVYGNSGRNSLELHRIIMSPSKGMVVDHINGDKLDNRKCNLRICSQQENTWNSKLSIKNTSGHKGVYKHNPSGKWAASIRYGNKKHHLGLYSNIEDAVKARKNAEIEHHGEFRRKEKEVV